MQNSFVLVDFLKKVIFIFLISIFMKMSKIQFGWFNIR